MCWYNWSRWRRANSYRSVDEEYLIDLADQIDNLEMVDGRYDLTINVFLRALVIKEAPSVGAPDEVRRRIR